MKNLILLPMAFLLLISVVVPPKGYSGAKTYGMVAGAISLPSSATSLLAPCTCSCGKNCDNSCTFNVSNCDLAGAIKCVSECCKRAPSPRPEECGGVPPEEGDN